MNADEDNMPAEPYFSEAVYNPYVDRNIKILQHSVDHANRDIAAGEEILDNFLNYAADAETWKRAVTDFRAQCAKMKVGSVSEFEEEE